MSNPTARREADRFVDWLDEGGHLEAEGIGRNLLFAFRAALANPTAGETDDEVEEMRWAEMLTHQECAAKKHPDWFIDSEHNILCPWCANDDLRARLSATEAVVNEMRANVDDCGRHLITEVGAERIRAGLANPTPIESSEDDSVLEEDRFYCIGLPVCFTIKTDGTITIGVDLAEADDIDEDEQAGERYGAEVVRQDGSTLSAAVATIQNHHSFTL